MNMIIYPLPLHEGLDIELVVVRDTEGYTLVFERNILMCAYAFVKSEVGILIEGRELGENLSQRCEFYRRAVGEQLHIGRRVHLATGTGHEPCIAFYMRILLHMVENRTHIIHLLLHIAWYRIPCTELSHLSLDGDREVEVLLNERNAEVVEASIVTGEMNKHNTFEEKENVVEAAFDAYVTNGRKLKFTIPARSVMMFRLK